MDVFICRLPRSSIEIRRTSTPDSGLFGDSMHLLSSPSVAVSLCVIALLAWVLYLVFGVIVLLLCGRDSRALRDVGKMADSFRFKWPFRGSGK